MRYHLSEYGPRHNPTNGKELYNLRHNSLRVTIERAIGALKNRFQILDNKSFHKYKTQVIKLVQAYCILHNWILEFGVDNIVPTEAEWAANPASSSTGPPVNDLQTQEVLTKASVRDSISDAMCDSRGF
jgi:hypothetical protein